MNSRRVLTLLISGLLLGQLAIPSAAALMPQCAGFAVTIDMQSGASGTGTSGRDVIRGTANADIINGLGGDDVICGLGGNDTIRGGWGKDQIYGHAGNDSMFGDGGDDTMRGGPGNDSLFGGNQNDLLLGQGGHDKLYGQNGKDVLNGANGDDELRGGFGDDRLLGGNGDDLCNGGAGTDVHFTCETASNASPNCAPLVPTFEYEDILLTGGADVAIRTRPFVNTCTDTGERAVHAANEAMRVVAEQGNWFYIDAIIDYNGNVLRPASGWVRRIDVGTNEAIRLSWDDGGTVGWNVDLPIRVTNTTNDVFFNQQFSWNDGGAGYFGFQQFASGRKFILSFFPSTLNGPGQVREFTSDYDCVVAFDEPGVFGPLRCLDDFNWQVGQTYILRLWRLGDEALGTRWGAWVLDSNGNDLFKVGEFVIRAPSNNPHGVSHVITFMEDFNNIRDCTVPNTSRFHVGAPSYNNGAIQSTYASDDISPCTNGSTAASTVFPGGRELRFNVPPS